MKNRPISVFLNSLGIAGVEQQAIARAVLEDEGYTRAGRTNMAIHKEAAAQQSLDTQLAFHCSTPTCQPIPQQTGEATPPRHAASSRLNATPAKSAKAPPTAARSLRWPSP